MSLEISTRPLAELHAYHKNPRRGATKAIAESLAKRGQYKPIVVNVGTLTGRPMEILAGNHTYLAAASLGWESIDVVTVDLPDDEAAQVVLADNKLADLGGYDDADLLATLEAAGSLEATGYTDQDVTALLRALDEPVGMTDPDDVPDVPEGATVTVEGDVWRLGPHVLYVGSSGNIDAVADAAQGAADAIWTDPPYGVSYVGGTGMTIKNDGADEAVQTFADAVATCLVVARPGAPVYVAHADLMRGEFQRVMAEAGILYRQTLIWVKNALVMGRADYHWQHEPVLEAQIAPDQTVEDFEAIAYGFTPGGEGRLGRGGQRWYGDNKSSTVFQVPKPKVNGQHPTMKPVELIERMLRNSLPAGGLVFDPFGGSGSTLIAAHRLGARSLLCELDPKYADVICRRWEEHTGVVPVRDGVPVSFVEAS